MKRYDPKAIESKWQQVWEASGIHRADEDPSKPKRYVLEYFPYPSGAAMHVGHVRNYTIGDAISRYWRMRGYNVMHPMGWDAFGLPAENYAIKTGLSPRQVIDEATAKFKAQLMQMGFGYDWSREIDSTDPKYYRWTQWFFLLLFKRGLAYQHDSLQWWCPVDKTVLANEQVEAGKCWRCGAEVEKKALKQWFFKITDYADRLVADLDKVNWSESIKTMQRNWIGRSRGAEVKFQSASRRIKFQIEVFTTRPDTLFGATFMVLAPEHPLVSKLTAESEKSKVKSYVKEALSKSDVERQETEREKTGVFTGAYAINPANNQKIPIWVADYVLMGYGTGAIMAVPAHDERDWEFAKKFKLPIVRVIKNDAPDEACTHEEGKMVNSGSYNGRKSEEAREKIVADLVQRGVAKEQVNYKIRDWLISRQRYWGAPIPIIHCAKCGVQSVPDKDLPVKLPDMKSYEPSGDGRSPLARVPEFVNTKCPQCDGKAQRETDTMDGFACSSWYFLRFADPHNAKRAFDSDKAKFWLPVDDYIGGAEHAVMHLLYARFWVKVMRDAGLVEFEEPFSTLRNHGMVLAPDGQKMSKSKNNTIEPDGLIEQGYGADAIRLMELFIGPWNQSANWSVEGLGGTFRFLQRVWTIAQDWLDAAKDAKGTAGAGALRRATHQAIRRVTVDMEELGFNTALAALMGYVNELYRLRAEHGFAPAEDWEFAFENLLKLLAPFAPHLSEELWHALGHKQSVHTAGWPEWDEALAADALLTIVVQVNGKLRDQLALPPGSSEADIIAEAKTRPKIDAYLKGKAPRKTIYVPGRLINFVI